MIKSVIIGIDKPTFRYVTAYNKEGRLIRPENIERTTINVLKPIIFLINDADKPEDNLKPLTEAYLSKQLHNVFLVSWNSPESTGIFLSEFISNLFNKTRESYLDIHLVGVSAGSYVAAELTRKVNRITAIDPTSDVILKNANFVDVVYSDLSKFGKLKQEGHVRFYLDSRNCKKGENL